MVDGRHVRADARRGARAGRAGSATRWSAILSIDSTVVRAHQHAAGARRDSVATRTRRGTQGAGSNHKKSRIVPGEPADHALGRSRGGLTTKVHALADLTCTPVLALLTAGQAGDNPMLAPLIEALVDAGHDRDFRLLADKAYSHPSTRTYLRGKTDQAHHPRAQRPDRAPQGQGLPGWAAARASTPRLYKLRNTVERSFNRFKQWRGLATRYDKYAVTYLGGVLLGIIVLTHRARSYCKRLRG